MPLGSLGVLGMPLGIPWESLGCPWWSWRSLGGPWGSLGLPWGSVGVHWGQSSLPIPVREYVDPSIYIVKMGALAPDCIFSLS